MLCIQWNFNTWNSLDLVGIHSSSAKCIIQIIDSFASAYQPMYNSSNTPSCCKSLSLQHMPFFLPETAWFLFIYLLQLALCVCLHTSTKPSVIHLPHFDDVSWMVLQWPVSMPRTASTSGFCACWLTCVLLLPDSYDLQGQREYHTRSIHTFIKRH